MHILRPEYARGADIDSRDVNDNSESYMVLTRLQSLQPTFSDTTKSQKKPP